MKINHTAALLSMIAAQLLSQSAEPSATAPTKLTPHAASIPKHFVYSHFLSMVNDLDKKATDAAEADPYKFAQPFSRARLENADLDVLRKHAKSIAKDLDKHDQKAKKLITDYRVQAKAAAQRGLPIPPLPIELSQLQSERTALMINHMLELQAELGEAKTKNLEAYFAREVTPHVRLEELAHRPANAKTP